MVSRADFSLETALETMSARLADFTAITQGRFACSDFWVMCREMCRKSEDGKSIQG
jgi:hypothetical protein